MAVSDHLAQAVDQPGQDARRMVRGQVERLGDAVGGDKPDALDIACQLEGIAAYHFHSPRAVPFANLNRQVGGHLD